MSQNSNIEVKVKDLITYLQKHDPETRLSLDKDGWMQDEIAATDAVDLIEKRGLFEEYNDLVDGKILCINN